MVPVPSSWENVPQGVRSESDDPGARIHSCSRGAMDVAGGYATRFCCCGHRHATARRQNSALRYG